MSHKATNWAFEVRGLKPGVRVVLLCLADCHNPLHGCFPSQAYIAKTCEISRGSVNTYLDWLETAGLIRREERVNGKGQQDSTRYYLAFEDEFSTFIPTGIPTGIPVATPGDKAVDNLDGRVQNLDTGRVQKSPETRVQNLDTNLVKDNNRKYAGARDCAGNPVLPTWQGDASIRTAIANDRRYGPGYARSWIDTATQLPDGTIQASGVTAAQRLSACEVLTARGIRVVAPP